MSCIQKRYVLQPRFRNPYLEEILGKGRYPLALYRKYLVDAALTVPGIETATVNFTQLDGRILSGTITFTNEDSQTGIISL